MEYCVCQLVGNSGGVVMGIGQNVAEKAGKYSVGARYFQVACKEKAFARNLRAGAS